MPYLTRDQMLVLSDWLEEREGEVEEVTGVLPITIPVKEICEELRRTPNEAGIYWTGAHWRIFIYRSSITKQKLLEWRSSPTYITSWRTIILPEGAPVPN